MNIDNIDNYVSKKKPQNYQFSFWKDTFVFLCNRKIKVSPRPLPEEKAIRLHSPAGQVVRLKIVVTNVPFPLDLESLSALKSQGVLG
jgi:hypothetical protein